ncbi:MAG TPA: hypothetical protein VKV20_14840 [Ktedonobacteraceae bacterium]|nr:hypothetical protein [Ktedonobacteraceae bacterium]
MSATEGRQGQGPTDIRAYRSIQLWIDTVDNMYHLSEAEWEGRLQLVQQFCEAEGKDPDEIIAEARSDRAEKIDYMRHLKRFVKTLTPNPMLAHDYENVVRSFFINNGARVVTKPYPDVYNRTE